jgi:alkane 1-monooxygenase
MQGKIYTYLFVYCTPVIILISMMMGGCYTYLALGYVFCIVPIVEQLLGGQVGNLDEVASQIAAEDRGYDYILYSIVPIQLGLMGYFLWTVGNTDLHWTVLLGFITAYGMAAGVMGINVAHELGHRSSVAEKTMSKILLASTLYMHFFIEHNRGHHNRVATDEDPASARYGESVYAFALRSITGGWISAWDLEAKRLQGKIWTLKNEMVVYSIIQLGILLGIYGFFGLQSCLAFVAASFIGILLLETVNYIEHYGLRRKKVTDKRYERTLPIHSWNSDYVLGRVLLFELTRHSDHHYQSDRKYQVLRHHDESPQLPAGYPSMMLMSLVPPLWFKVMHHRIAEYKKTEAGMALA